MNPLIIVGVLVTALVVGLGSTLFLGKDNEIEKISEAVIEKELNLPPGTIHLGDLKCEKNNKDCKVQ